MNSSTPDSESPTAVQTGSLETHVEFVSHEVSRRCAAFSDTVSESVIHSIQETFAQAESDVVRIVRESGLLEASSSTGDIDPQTAWLRIRNYRHIVQKDILLPVTEKLAELDIGDRICTMFDTLVSDLAGLEQGMPEKLIQSEVPDLYASSIQDNPYVGLRKLAVRIQRGLSELRGPQTRQQRVFLRILTRAHTNAIIPAILSSRANQGMNDIALMVAGVERELTRLAHELLEAEVTLDRSRYHAPSTNSLVGLEDHEANRVNPAGETDARESDEKSVRSREALGEEPGEATGEATGEEISTGQASEDAEHLNVLDQIRTANSRLLAALESARQFSGKNWNSVFTGAVILAVDSFRKDVDRSDTFMVTGTLRKGIAESTVGNTARTHRLRERWQDWHRESVSRLQLVFGLGKLRDELVQLTSKAVDGAFDAGLNPISDAHLKTARELNHLHIQADQFFGEGLDRFGLSVMQSQLEKLQTKSTDLVETGVVAVYKNLALETSLARSNDEVLEHVSTVSASLPDTFLLHALPEESDQSVDLSEDVRTIDLQAITRQALEDPFSVDLKKASGALLTQSETLSRGIENVLGILRFNLGAAHEELSDARGIRSDKQKLNAAIAAGRELTLNGLDRSSDALLASRAQMKPVGDAVVHDYFRAFSDAWITIHERARAESQVQKALVGARSMVAEQKRSFGERLRTSWDSASTNLRRLTRLGKRRAKELVRLGQEAVGAPDQQESAFQETMEALIGLDEIVEAAPIVYRRLFSFHPLSDPDFLEGRVNDKRNLVKHIQAWRKGIPRAYLITGSPSCGLTSFLNVMTQTVLRSVDVRSLSLKTRILDERELTDALVGSLGIGSDGIDKPTTLRELSDNILSKPTPDEPVICIVEHLDHLFLRSIGGTSLVREFLTMISHTDSRLIWILTIADFGWQLIEKCEPSAAGLIFRHELAPIDRDVLEQLIMKRHSRSGLQVRFSAPEDPNPLLTRRLKSARTAEERQAIHREVFFDRLHNQCGQNIMLALFYWLSAVSLDEAESEMNVKPFVPIKFGFLSGYSLQQSLALKALLEHETLTIEEFSVVDKCSLTTSMEVFESLGNALLIEAVYEDSRPGRFDFVTLESGTRYRIRPLIVHPIIQYLRSKNIVH